MVIIGVLAGVLIGVALGFILLITRVDHPTVAILGRSRDGRLYNRLTANGNATAVPGVLIYGSRAALVFANAESSQPWASSSTGERSGAVVIPQCVGGAPGPTESEMPGVSSALNHSARFGRSVVVDWQQRLGFVWRLRLLERDQVRVGGPQPTRLGASVTRRKVSEGAGIDDLVDGLLDQDLEVEAERVVLGTRPSPRDSGRVRGQSTP